MPTRRPSRPRRPTPGQPPPAHRRRRSRRRRRPPPRRSEEPAETPEEEPTEEPTEAPTEEPSDEPSPEPTEEPSASPDASASPAAGPADGCTGSADNKEFFATYAAAVPFDAYCAVLPKGWTLTAGGYSKRVLTVTYKGPRGARLDVIEGPACAGKTDCPPAGGAPGSAQFAGREARLTDLGGARFAVIAEEGDIIWQVSGTGIDADTLLQFSAAFIGIGR